MKFWNEHSLSVVMVSLGIGLIVFAFIFEEGKIFDLWLGLGQGVLTAALLFVLSRWFRETAKPEDPPEESK